MHLVTFAGVSLKCVSMVFLRRFFECFQSLACVNFSPTIVASFRLERESIPVTEQNDPKFWNIRIGWRLPSFFCLATIHQEIVLVVGFGGGCDGFVCFPACQHFLSVHP